MRSRGWLGLAVAFALAMPAPVAADSIEILARAAESVRPSPARKPIVGFRVRGRSKVKQRTVGYLAHVALGDLVGPDDIPRLAQALLSSELFKKVAVALEDAPGGVLVVATLDDKHSWIIAPTIFALPGRRSLGVGFAENNFRGNNQKLLLYGQLGDRESLFFGTYLDPSVRGTKLTWRFDVFTYRRIVDEYANPPDDPTNDVIARTSTSTYLGGGALLGWTFKWWLISDLRLRGAYVYFEDAHTDEDPPTPVPVPQTDGWDVSAQWRTTLDRRGHRYGVTWGPYLQLVLETTIPGLDDYDYQTALLRAYYSWRLFGEHQLELRAIGNVGRRLPFHEELTLGGVVDLRGYAVDRIRGDTRLVYRTEYSLPLAKWKFFAFRAIGFWDTGYITLNFPRPNGDRDYLPAQRGGEYWRNDVGVGLRIYLKNIVLPLLGLDLAYGIEGRSPEVYFEVGLTDF